MRNMLLRMARVGIAVGLLGIGATAAQAQMVHPVNFTTDFKFIAGNTTFPAGKYEIRPVEGSLDLVEISGGNVAAYVEVSPQRLKRTEPAKDEIAFNRYGPFPEVLSQIWDAVDNSGVQIVKARAELLAEKKYSKPTQRTVIAIWIR